MARNKPLKLVIDTNVWISFIISNKQNLLDQILFSEKAILLFSEELIAEINLTASKPKLKKYFGANAVEEMFSVFEPFVDFVQITSTVDICRDPNDNFLLALAKDGKADYLLTGDNDLLELKRFGKTKIKTISTFLNEI